MKSEQYLKDQLTEAKKRMTFLFDEILKDQKEICKGDNYYKEMQLQKLIERRKEELVKLEIQIKIVEWVLSDEPIPEEKPEKEIKPSTGECNAFHSLSFSSCTR